MKIKMTKLLKGYTLPGSNVEWFSTSAVAKSLPYTKYNGNIRMRAFLIERKVFNEYGLHPQFLNDGYFLEHNWGVKDGMAAYSIKVSRKGVNFIEKLLAENQILINQQLS